MKWPEPSAHCERSAPQDRLARQLLEALLFEGILKLPAGRFSDWQRLRFAAGQGAYECLVRVGAFGRVRVRPGSLRRCNAPGPAAVAEPLWREILKSVPASPQALDRLTSELEQTETLCRWNHSHLGVPAPRRSLPYPLLESALDEGHPYHPCFKARTGFSLGDHRRYGPECGQAFALSWVAIHRSRLRQALPLPEADFWRGELGEEFWFRLRAAFNRRGLAWSEYAALPVHPWQWEKLSCGPVHSACARGELVPLGTFGDRFRSTQTVRTLLNASNPKGSVLKLPLSMVNTSALRILAPHSVVTAPALSAWLKACVSRDHFFRDEARLVILAEFAGMIHQPDPEDAESLPGHLGALWRENPESYLDPGEAAVPFNALMLWESDDRPFIDDWVQAHGLENWLAQLIKCAVLPVWHLLVGHGIALEAHAQNMVLFHRDGWPTGIALRDFHESVEYVEDFLARPQACPDFGSLDPVYREAPDDRFFRMASVEALRELVMDTLFVFNLAELSFLLESAYGLPEHSFWHLVRRQLNAYALAGHSSRARIHRLGYQCPTIRSEALLTRKLHPNPDLEHHHHIANSLAPQGRTLSAPTHRSHHPARSRHHVLRQ